MRTIQIADTFWPFINRCISGLGKHWTEMNILLPGHGEGEYIRIFGERLNHVGVNEWESEAVGFLLTADGKPVLADTFIDEIRRAFPQLTEVNITRLTIHAFARRIVTMTIEAEVAMEDDASFSRTYEAVPLSGDGGLLP